MNDAMRSCRPTPRPLLPHGASHAPRDAYPNREHRRRRICSRACSHGIDVSGCARYSARRRSSSAACAVVSGSRSASRYHASEHARQDRGETQSSRRSSPRRDATDTHRIDRVMAIPQGRACSQRSLRVCCPRSPPRSSSSAELVCRHATRTSRSDRRPPRATVADAARAPEHPSTAQRGGGHAGLGPARRGPRGASRPTFSTLQRLIGPRSASAAMRCQSSCDVRRNDD
jgi:hypothetical protein